MSPLLTKKSKAVKIMVKYVWKNRNLFLAREWSATAPKIGAEMATRSIEIAIALPHNAEPKSASPTTLLTK